MDKYTKTFLMILRIPLGIFYSLLGLGLIGISIWVSTFADIASMILIISLLSGGLLINYGIGYAFLGDEYKATHLVRDGRTVFTPVETNKFLKRRKLVTFIGFISYIVLAVQYVIRAILVGIYYDYLQDIDFNTNIPALIIFAIISMVIALCIYLVYKKTKHIDLEEK